MGGSGYSHRRGWVNEEGWLVEEKGKLITGQIKINKNSKE